VPEVASLHAEGYLTHDDSLVTRLLQVLPHQAAAIGDWVYDRLDFRPRSGWSARTLTDERDIPPPTLPWSRDELEQAAQAKHRWARDYLAVEAAAARGDAEACFELGRAQLDGRCQWLKPEDAASNLKKAAAAGHGDARRLLEILGA